MQSSTFADLMQRVRGGDDQAVRTLVEEYGDAIRREVRFSLLDGRVRRFVSESDICQSVLTRLCLGLWAGNYEIDDPAQLIGLLKTMVHARVIDWTRHERAQRRDIRRSVPLDSDLGNLPALPNSVTPVWSLFAGAPA